MNTVGNLVVKLTAHTAEFTEGLQRASASATASANRISSAFGSQSIVAGSFGVGELDNTAKVASKAENAISNAVRGIKNSVSKDSAGISVAAANIEAMMMRLSKSGIGGFALGMTRNISNAAGAMLGLGAAASGVVGAMVGGTVAVIKLGNSIKEDKEQARQLGITYEQFKQKAGEIAISSYAQKGAEDFASTWSVIWRYTKAAAQEIAGLAAFAVGSIVGGVMPEMPGEKQSVRFRREEQARLAGLMPSVGNPKQVAAMLDQWNQAMNAIGKTDLEVFTARLVAAGASIGQVAEAVRSWNTAMERTRPKVQHEPVVKDWDPIKEAAEKADEIHQKWYESLVAQGEQLAKTPLDTFSNKLDALYAALDFGSITQEQFDAAKKNLQADAVKGLMADMPKSVGAASAMMGGSRELFNAIADSSVNNRSPQLEEAKKQTRLLERIAAEKAAQNQESKIP